MNTSTPTDHVACECGQTCSNDPCTWTGPWDETVLVDWMPRQHRASHEAAGNSGRWPHNGALRLRVSLACADLLRERDGDWTEAIS